MNKETSIEIITTLKEMVDELKFNNKYTCEAFRYSKYYRDYIEKICDDFDIEIKKLQD